MTDKRRTRILGSVHNAHAGAFSITAAILIATSIFYVIFPFEIAVGQEWWWIPVINMDFMFDYPSFLEPYDIDGGLLLMFPSEVGLEKPSFKYVLLAVPYQGQSQTLEELAHEVTSMIVQGIPHAQFTYVGLNDNGDRAVVEYTYDDMRGMLTAFVSGGKFYVYGFDWLTGPNESEYINIGLGIQNTVHTTAGVSTGGLATAQGMVDSWGESLDQSGAELNRQIQEEQTQERICNNNPNSTCPP